MLGHRQMSMDDYVGILRRRAWLLVIPAVVLCGGTYLGSLKIKNRYVSTTKVLVLDQRVPDSIVKPVVNEDPNQRLASMQEQILSRSRLEPINDRFGLFMDHGQSPEERYNALAKATVVTPIAAMSETRAPQLPGFTISVTLYDAHLAQQVCAEITSLFIQEDSKNRGQKNLAMKEFLTKALADAQQKMNDQDQKLAAFKRRNLGELPEQENTNLGLLTGINTELSAVSQAIDHEQGNKSMYESMLSQQLAAWKATQQTSAGPSASTLEAELKQKESELAKLREQYYDDFPSVKKKVQEIEDLKKKIAAAETSKPSGDVKEKPVDSSSNASLVEPVNIQQLRTQIRVAELTIQEKQKQQKKLEDLSNMYQARLQMSPAVEQEYKELTRDFATAQESYNDLLKKRTQADLSNDLDTQQEGAQFRILDEANLPEKPSYPNRILFAGGGFGGGLALGLALIVIFEMRDKSLRTESDVDALLKLPVLAMVPSIGPNSQFVGRYTFKASKEKPSLTAGA